MNDLGVLERTRKGSATVGTFLYKVVVSVVVDSFWTVKLFAWRNHTGLKNDKVIFILMVSRCTYVVFFVCVHTEKLQDCSDQWLLKKVFLLVLTKCRTVRTCTDYLFLRQYNYVFIRSWISINSIGSFVSLALL